jgi:hypothetical protein
MRIGRVNVELMFSMWRLPLPQRQLFENTSFWHAPQGRIDVVMATRQDWATKVVRRLAGVGLMRSWNSQSPGDGIV